MAKRKASELQELSVRAVADCWDDSVGVANNDQSGVASLGKPTGWGSGERVAPNSVKTQGDDVALPKETEPGNKEGVAVNRNRTQGTGVAITGRSSPGDREGAESTSSSIDWDDVSEGGGSDLNPFFRLLLQAGYEIW